MPVKVQKAVREETIRMTEGCILCTCFMFLMFWTGHYLLPGFIPMDYTVVLGGIVGSAVAVANFFLLGLTVQKVADTADEKDARRIMQASYSRRMLLQGLWLIVSLLAPCFYWIAGALPLLFPRITIFLLQITGQFKPEKKDGEN